MNGTYYTLYGYNLTLPGPPASGSFQSRCAVAAFGDQEMGSDVLCFDGYWELIVYTNDAIGGAGRFGQMNYGMSAPAGPCPPSTWNLTSANNLGGVDVGSFTVTFN